MATPPRWLIHLVEPDAWAAARTRGVHHPPSLDTEGFVHLSTLAQAVGTVGRYYAGISDLLVLLVDQRLLPEALRWEEAPHGGLYPHLYAQLPVPAVVLAEPWPLAARGALPAAVLDRARA